MKAKRPTSYAGTPRAHVGTELALELEEDTPEAHRALLEALRAEAPEDGTEEAWAAWSARKALGAYEAEVEALWRGRRGRGSWGLWRAFPGLRPFLAPVSRPTGG